MDRNEFSSYKIVAILLFVNERLNELVSLSEISFFSSFNTLVGILYEQLLCWYIGMSE